MYFQVGSWQVHADRNVITSDGHSIHVSPKSMEVLQYLASRRGQVVGKDELIRALWANVFVTDDALTRCIVELRRAVGDDAREPSFIQTVPKRGYALLPEVVWGDSAATVGSETNPPEVEGKAKPTDARQKKWGFRTGLWLSAAFAIAVLATLVFTTYHVITRSHASASRPRHRLAVIPLVNVSSDPQQEYFADGLTEQLITDLAQISAWEVISRTSVMPYKNSRKALPQIGRELSADWLVEGTVQRAGGHVRITAQLINAATDTHLWSESFDRDMSDVLQIQSEIARKIAAEMDLTLARHEQMWLGAVKKVDPEAYDAYLRGRYFLDRNEFSTAANYFQEATLKDPNFAIAYALLWEADSMTTFVQDVAWSERAVKAAHKALELDDTLAEAHTAAGDLKFYGEWDWAAGEAEFRRAVELNPNSTDASLHYATCLHLQDRSEAALAEIHRALGLDPASLRLNQTYLWILINIHRYGEALEQSKRTIELEPNNPGSYVATGEAYQELGRVDEALAAYLRADTLGGADPETLKLLKSAATSGGLRGYFRQQLVNLERKSQTERVPPISLARLNALSGESDEALRLLEIAYNQHSAQLAWIRVGYSWDALRNDPRFRSLLERMHFPQ